MELGFGHAQTAFGEYHRICPGRGVRNQALAGKAVQDVSLTRLAGAGSGIRSEAIVYPEIQTYRHALVDSVPIHRATAVLKRRDRERNRRKKGFGDG